MKLSTPFGIAPSILSADFSRLGEEVRAVTRAGAQLIHVDVMDGHFVPNLTLGPDIVAAIRRCTHLPLDVHLMIERPELYIKAFVDAGANIVTVHAEATVHLHRLLQSIRELGVKAGVAINPGTPLSVLEPILEDCDLILIMTVNPGFGGQKPIRGAIRKLKALRTLLAQAELRGESPSIEVDGGVKIENVLDFADADLFVSGSGVFEYPERGEARKKTLMSEAELSASYARVLRVFCDKLSEVKQWDARHPVGD